MNIKEKGKMSGLISVQLDKLFDIYQVIEEENISIFLCGGASTKDHKSFRDCLRDELEPMKNLKIFYPEDLFIEMLKKDSRNNLLQLENLLAVNCDVLCIVGESPGSFAELGAFINNENTIDKVVALVQNKYKKADSFIMLGPIRLLKNHNERQVVFYNDKDIDTLTKKLRKLFREKKNKAMELGTIIGLYYYILILLFFFGEISTEKLIKYIEYTQDRNNLVFEFDLNTLFRASLKQLYKEKLIVKDQDKYLLTLKGKMKSINILYNLNIEDKVKLYDCIRFDIMNYNYYP